MKELPGECVQLDSLKIHHIVRHPRVLIADRLPAVLIHGFAANSFTWNELQPVLARQTLTHSVDLPGMGYSGRPRGRQSLLSYVQFLKDYLDHQQIERCDLVGHSLGGAIIFLFSLEYPERVRKLTLLAPLIRFERVQSGVLGSMVKAVSTPVLAQSLLSLYGRWFTKLFLKKIMVEKHLITPDLIRGYFEPSKLEDSMNSLYELNRLIADRSNRNLESRIHEISHSCLLLWGEQDPLLPIEDAALFRQAVNSLQFESYPGCGHMLMHERSLEVNSRICQFLLE